MTSASTTTAGTPSVAAQGDAALARLVREQLRPRVVAIDRQGQYPAEFLRHFGALGGFLPPGPGGIASAIESTAQVAQVCGSTAFLTWCQNACLWYLLNTPNQALRDTVLPELATGIRMGATALSNPVKAFSGIEAFKLSATRVQGGYRVNGSLPWVSNLGRDHAFPSIFKVGDSTAMALFDCAQPGVAQPPTAPFIALEGTATFALRFKDVFVPESAVLAAPAAPFVQQVQPGFVLLQTGIGLGLLRGAIEDMTAADSTHRLANQHLPDRPAFFAEQLALFETRIASLAQLPTTIAVERLRDILQLRLDLAELVLRATMSAVLHAGAAGFIATAAPQRRHREALFFAILTPATKHLRLLLAAGPSATVGEPQHPV
jgi:alkylation response protein AidB-like acyl-CoA dehydrogenase